MPFITARVISVIRDDVIAALAFAGSDQSVLCTALVQLQGQIIGDDIANHRFEWEQTAGTPVTLINPNTLTPSFVNPLVSDLEFTLYLDRNTPYEDSDAVFVSRAPQSSMTAVGGGTASSTNRPGTATAASNISGTNDELINGNAHVTGWVFNEPPSPRYSLIYSAADLKFMRENLNGQYWLMNDIDLGIYDNWEPIGTASKPFSGELQGNGHKIQNLTIISTTKDAGIFSCISNGALIEKVGITNATISGVGSSIYKGILAGQASADVTVRDCYVEGTVASGGDKAGGLIGHTGTNASSIYENTYADVTITGGGTDTGGWAGTFDATPTYIENYSNTTKTAAVVGTGAPAGTEVSGLTTAQLAAEANYTGWDFVSTWEIDEGVSPATLQQFTGGRVDQTGKCDDNWMITWDTPAMPASASPPRYVFRGTIVEEWNGSGWVYPRWIPKERHGAWMTPATTHRITSVWDQLMTSSLGRLVSFPVKNIRVINNEKFTSKETSYNYGPYGASAITTAIGGTKTGSKNFNISISNPSKISLAQADNNTMGIGGAATTSTGFLILRLGGASKAFEDAAASYGIGGTATGNTNLNITRLSGASIGGG